MAATPTRFGVILFSAALLISFRGDCGETPDNALPFYSDKLNLLNYVDDAGKNHPVKTAADWEKRRAHVLQGMQRVMGALPDASRIVAAEIKVEQEEDFPLVVRKKISFAVEKDDRLKAYLFIPKKREGKVPAMLCLHQTTGIGKNEPAGIGGLANLHYAKELAERGYVTLAPDYPYLGEYKLDVYAKGYESGTMKGIWNHMRAVDLLQAMPEVDAERIGVIGHSLGGHNSLFVAAFDPRLKVVVTSCGFTSFGKYNSGGKGMENWASLRYMPRITKVYENSAARMPFDFTEILGAIAPRAVFINAPVKDDNFSLPGVKECITASVPIFELLGGKEKLAAAHPDCAHDFPPAIREQAYQFIDKALDRK